MQSFNPIFLFGFASAQIFKTGPCPNVTLQENFKIHKLEGIWFEVERSFSLQQLGQRCGTFQYHMASDDQVDILQNGVDLFGRTVSVSGVGRVLGVGLPTLDGYETVNTTATMDVLMDGGGPLAATSPVPYNILITDYKNYALLSICINVGVVHSENIWLLSRRPKMESPARDLLHYVTKANGFNPKDLLPTPQDCWDVTDEAS